MPNDPDEIGPIEEAQAQMAEAAGLVMGGHRLISARQGPGYFSTRRFDPTDEAGRLHMVSLAGAVEAPIQPGIVSYDTFLRVAQAITHRKFDVATLCRMLFYIFPSNRHDHTRQHTYLMAAHGDWRLAPAYDLTLAPGPGGEHYLDIEGEGRNPTRARVLRLDARHSLGAKAVTATAGNRTEGSLMIQRRPGRWPGS